MYDTYCTALVLPGSQSKFIACYTIYVHQEGKHEFRGKKLQC